MNVGVSASSLKSNSATRPALGERNPADHPAVLTAIQGLLADLGRFIATLTDAQYVDAAVTGPRGAIGAHVRHSLDHVGALLDGADDGLIDYDARHRGTPDECDRTRAIGRIDVLNARLSRLAPSMDRPVRVRACVSIDSPQVEMASTVGREMLFVLSHTIHHQAMIAAAATRLNVPTPAEFGYAPATRIHLAADRSATVGS